MKSLYLKFLFLRKNLKVYLKLVLEIFSLNFIYIYGGGGRGKFVIDREIYFSFFYSLFLVSFNFILVRLMEVIFIVL